MTSVVLTGASSPLGRRVAALLASDGRVAQVVALDGRPGPEAGSAGVFHQLDLAVDDLKAHFERVDTVVHLVTDAVATRRVLDTAGAVGVTTLVLLSSATVYGAWSNNPVPLTEEALVRPRPGMPLAVACAEIERLAHEWRAAHPGATVAVLRPAVTLAEDQTGWMARALRAAAGIQAGDSAAPMQFVHLDDVATAVEVARTGRLDGPLNVAPDGWLSADQLQALAGHPRLRLPVPVATRLAGWGWRLRLAPTPPALVPYTMHPWVVANDRLRAAGWEPSQSNEEAYVAGHHPGRLALLSPQRRQELALGAGAAGAAGVIFGAVSLVRRLRARHRAPPG
ncbi:SDR family oxidoreductase [soil metagenome]